MDGLNHPLVGIAGAMAFQELELHMVERIDVGKAVADRARAISQNEVSGHDLMFDASKDA